MMSYFIRVKRLVRIRLIFFYLLCLLLLIVLGVCRRPYLLFVSFNMASNTTNVKSSLISTPKMPWTDIVGPILGVAGALFVIALALQMPLVYSIGVAQYSGTLGKDKWQERVRIASLVFGYLGIALTSIVIYPISGIPGIAMLIFASGTNWWDFYSRWIIPSDVLNRHNNLPSVYVSNEPWNASDTKEDINLGVKRDIWKFEGSGPKGECQMIQIKQGKLTLVDTKMLSYKEFVDDFRVDLLDVFHVEIANVDTWWRMEFIAKLQLGVNWAVTLAGSLVVIILAASGTASTRG